jgi:hypothetical protein
LRRKKVVLPDFSRAGDASAAVDFPRALPHLRRWIFRMQWPRLRSRICSVHAWYPRGSIRDPTRRADIPPMILP